MTSEAPLPLRRVITGHAPDGSSTIVSDSRLEPQERANSLALVTSAWDSNGTHAGVLDLPVSFQSVFHRTETVDFVVVLFGDVELVLDAGPVRLGTGDLLIQRGTQHQWRNLGALPARLLFVSAANAPPA